MNRWKELDTDKERLPSGMTRIGYDAETQIYSYRDVDGNIWEGAPGVQYGNLHCTQRPDAPPPPPDFKFCRAVEPWRTRYDPNVEDFLASARAKPPPAPEKDTPPKPPPRPSPSIVDTQRSEPGEAASFSRRRSVLRKPLPNPLSTGGINGDGAPSRMPSVSSSIRRKPVSPAAASSVYSSTWSPSVTTLTASITPRDSPVSPY